MKQDQGSDRARTTTRTETEEILIEDLVKAFVWNPDDVRVVRNTAQQNDIQILELHVNKKDCGAVIGKSGRKITALQVIAQFLGIKERKQIRLLLPEQERDPSAGFPEPFIPNPKWEAEPVVELLRRVLTRILSNPFNIAVIETRVQTNLEIAADPNDQKFVTTLMPYLHTIFHAIGKAQGREIYVKEAAPVPTG